MWLNKATAQDDLPPPPEIVEETPSSDVYEGSYYEGYNYSDSDQIRVKG